VTIAFALRHANLPVENSLTTVRWNSKKPSNLVESYLSPCTRESAATVQKIYKKCQFFKFLPLSNSTAI